MNPLSNDLNVMRQTLLFGGLESIQHNANRKNADLKFFEFGNCYFYNAEKKNPEYYAEINWKELMKAIKSAKVNFKELSKFPAVKRDLALLIDKNIQFAEIEKIAYETEKKLLKEVELFDVYEGKNLEPGKKSYAVSFLLQDESATLNDKQIDKIMSKLIANLENKLGAKLR